MRERSERSGGQSAQDGWTKFQPGVQARVIERVGPAIAGWPLGRSSGCPKAELLTVRQESAVSGSLANPVHVRSYGEKRTYTARENNVRLGSVLTLGSRQESGQSSSKTKYKVLSLTSDPLGEGPSRTSGAFRQRNRRPALTPPPDPRSTRTPRRPSAASPGCPCRCGRSGRGRRRSRSVPGGGGRIGGPGWAGGPAAGSPVGG